MVITCRDIVTDALKLARVLSSGETPSAEEADDGMNCLQSLYDSWVSGGMFGTLLDTYLTDDADAQEGRRYYVPAGITLTDATNDYTPEFGDAYTECDYASGIGPTRQPRDLALYESLTAAGTRTVKLYDRTDWVSLTGLTINDTAPMADRDRMGFAACLATYGGFAAMFGDTATMNPDVRQAAMRFLGSIAGKVGSTQDDAGSVYY